MFGIENGAMHKVCSFVFFEIEGRHANTKAHDAVDHLTNFPSSREEISQLRIKLPTSSALQWMMVLTMWSYGGWGLGKKIGEFWSWF